MWLACVECHECLEEGWLNCCNVVVFKGLTPKLCTCIKLPFFLSVCRFKFRYSWRMLIRVGLSYSMLGVAWIRDVERNRIRRGLILGVTDVPIQFFGERNNRLTIIMNAYSAWPAQALNTYTFFTSIYCPNSTHTTWTHMNAHARTHARARTHTHTYTHTSRISGQWDWRKGF